ncbi:jg4759 [Pararge aegeria aegeria]|uniref:Jg4759 protein n=1 Tax=Pararge aegeria aegeria TaxID=348720 RepID=A0A8S4R9S9_9NEOP|nr:jg4759 [Pararge aegeria aegeria]
MEITIRKIRQITDVDTARLVYFAYFHSVMSYGILIWGKAADIETIFILQKRAVRSIYKLKSRESLREKFKEIGTTVGYEVALPLDYLSAEIITSAAGTALKPLTAWNLMLAYHKRRVRYRNTVELSLA